MASPNDVTAASPPGRQRVDPRAAQFPADWPRYTFVDLLGEGGMGMVFKARDTQLQRLVAIKFVHGADPGWTRRLEREAMAQARIDHPNVCKVYEVGTVAGRAFVVMQLIDGQTLTQLLTELTLNDKLRVLQKVSEAVAAAHALGIVHRDLKPSNIMCERREDGALLPFVTDFGLARDPRDATLTQSHAVLGTPAFMPPEQARGDLAAIDGRSDVYALGATLYALLAGRPPFEGATTAELIVKTLNEPPPRLCRLVPSLPADVETIVLKCLEKEPDRRYGSARALADDLARVIDGRPILARPPSRIYRAQLFVKRHRSVTAVSLLALGVSVGLLGWQVKTRLDARRLAALTERYARAAAESEQVMRVSALMPEHDITRDRDSVRHKLDALAQEVARAGRLAVGPGDYALARGHFALGELDSARDELERAWAAGQRSPEVAYALGEAWERLWERDRDEASREAADEHDHARERDARALAGQWLARARSASNVDGALLEATIDYVNDRLPQARAEAQQAFAHDPLLFEARRLEGSASSQLGHKLAGKGDLVHARAEYARAETVLLAAAEIARSDFDARFQLCRLYDRILELPPLPGAPRRDDVAIDACRAAVRVDPTSDAALSKLAIALNRRAELAETAGQDARALLAESRPLAERAVALRPRFINHYRLLANTLRLQGDFDGAIAVIQRGLGSNPDAKSALKLEVTAAAIETQRGREQLAHGQPADAAVAAALAAVARARAYGDGYRAALADAGARTLAAAAAVAAHRDPTRDIAAAQAAVAKTLALTHERTPMLTAYSDELERLSAAPRLHKTALADDGK